MHYAGPRIHEQPSRLRMKNIVLLIGVMLGSAGLGQEPAAGYALRGTLVTPGGIVENGTIFIRQGKIVALGTQVELPPNATVIDTHGVISPGLIDLHNHLT